MYESNKEVVDILEKTGAVIKNSHFVGTSGRHMSAYINKDKLLPHTKHVSEIGELFAKKFKNKKIDIVVGPAVAGIPFSQWTAYHLSKMNKKDVLSLYTEKTTDNNQVLKRGYDLMVKNKRVLIVEDITTFGSSIKKVINSVKKAKGKIVGVCVMVNRDPKMVNTKSIGVPFSSLSVFETPSYEENKCPLCKNYIPINITVGHGKKFLEDKNR